MPPSSKREINHRLNEINLDLVPLLSNSAPGIRPVEYNIIVAPMRMAEKIGSILLADETRDTEGLAKQIGRIVAQSPLAYSYETWPDPSLRPQVGDVVWFARYAGALFTGFDGEEYRILKDKDIGAVIPPTPAEGTL
jgi:co-chaperonin GroES (HSP10)